MIKKILLLFIISILSLILIFSNSSIISGLGIEPIKLVKNQNYDDHLIEDVPYVGQYYNLHCSYASRTMCIKHLGINVSLEDILFHSGLAYSMGYPFEMPSFDMNFRYMPMGGYIISQDIKDVSHLASIYGFKFNEWEMPINESENGWEIYLQKVKENISANIPVVTSVHPLKLKTFRSFLNIHEKILDILSRKPGGHGVVIVGYNDSNNTICFNDPLALFFGNPAKGTYIWMDQNSFLDAVNNTSIDSYLIRTITKMSEPMDEKLAFNISHKRNLERLKGNASAYANYSEKENIEYTFGIEAVNDLKEKFNDKEECKNVKKAYKTKGRKLKILKPAIKIISLLGIVPDRFEEMSLQNEFEKNALEKLIASEYLKNNSYLSDICIYDAELFEAEAEKWMELSNLYSKFIERLVYNFSPFASIILKKMADVLDEIIVIEQAIIDDPLEF